METTNTPCQGQRAGKDTRMVYKQVVRAADEQGVCKRVDSKEEHTTTVAEEVGGAEFVQSRKIADGRVVQHMRVWWGSNDSKKYDGKVEDVPAEW